MCGPLVAEIIAVPFAMRCPGCNAILRAPDKAAGRTLTCPGCKTPVTFPKTPPAPTSSPTSAAPAAPKQPAAEPKPPAVPNLSLDDPPATRAPVIPNMSLDDPPAPKPAPKPAAFPNLSLDDPPASSPPSKPAKSSASALPDLGLDEMPNLLDDGPKAPAKPAAKPPAAPTLAAGALSDLNLDDMPGLLGDEPKPKPPPAAPKTPPPIVPYLSLDDSPSKATPKAKPKADEPDFELVEDEPPAKKPAPSGMPKMELDEVEEPLDEVQPLDEPDAIEGLEEVQAVEEEEVLDAELVEEELDHLEEVEPPRRRSWLDDSKLMRLRLVHVKAQKVSFVETMAKMDNAGHDLIDPGSDRKIGEAVEVRDGAAQAVRYLVGRTFMETRVEIREGRHGDLLAVIRRPPYLWESALEILDPDDRVLGVFERTPLSAITAKTVWIKTKGGKKLLQMRPQPGRGKMVLMARDGSPLGEMLTESAYEQRLKIYWMTRGCGYYVRFTSELDDRPEDKLRFLAAVVGLDLFTWEHVR